MTENITKYICTEELLDRLSISRPTLRRYRARGLEPAFFIGRTMRWNYEDVIKWLENNQEATK
ncbi:helix-turn-helix transcriptional regulator [Xanthobacter sp. TB0136]|uniref:helix-turn-helix transcriptional regulator n=1 Tax=Xanthobacter sp. TB0136 TaxID=3459177 RepID=UPI004039E89D